MVARRSASSEFLGATATGLIVVAFCLALLWHDPLVAVADRKSTRLNSSHSQISYAVFCLKKKNELADLLGVLGRDLLRHLDEEPADELARLLERRHALLLGPVRETAGPEVIVLVEATILALGEVLAVELQAVLDRGQCLVAVEVDLLALGLDLVLEVVQVFFFFLIIGRPPNSSLFPYPPFFL